MTLSPCLFAAFDVSRQVFYRSPLSLSLAIVNLKPLLPGHVLIIPQRVVPRLSDLHTEEITDLFLTVQKVGRVIEKAYDGQALTISLQDGIVAGQSVPHVHIHLIPRKKEDYNQNDEIYPALEKSEHQLKDDLEHSSVSASSIDENGLISKGGRTMKVPKDEDRKPRSMQEMESEAQWLASLFSSS